MTASTSSAEDQSRQPPQADPSQPHGLLVAGADRCAECGTALALDQRYCVECGARRGNPRFVLASAATQERLAAPVVRVAGGWSRLSGVLAVIAVLLALGVGVLIGTSTQAGVKQPVKVQLTGGSLATGGGSGASTAKPASGGGASTAKPGAGGSGATSPNSCSKGTPGCKNGKQTGNFFGG